MVLVIKEKGSLYCFYNEESQKLVEQCNYNELYTTLQKLTQRYKEVSFKVMKK